MSQNDSENDIWNYKPLKKKRKQDSPYISKTVAKRRGAKPTRGTNNGPTSSSALSPLSNSTTLNTPLKASTSETVQNGDHNNGEEQSDGNYCPVCQMPFAILLVQSQRWHVVDCLDFCRDTFTECPDGLLCSSTIPNHYRNFNHSLLAQSRAKGDVPLPHTPTSDGNQFESEFSEDTNDSGSINNHVNQPDTLTLKTSQEDFHMHSSLSSPVSNSHTKSPKISNGLSFLRSPAPEDLKKKKGWSSPKVQKSLSSSQESKTEISSTPVKKPNDPQTCSIILKSAPSPSEIDDAISYSPLSELPAEVEISQNGPRRALFDTEPGGKETEDSVVEFSDNEDDIFVELLNNLDKEEAEASSLNHQVLSVASSGLNNQETPNKATSKREKERPGSSLPVVSSGENSIQSPQRIVLERLRDTILNSAPFSQNTLSIQPERTNSGNVPPAETMTPQKTQSKAGQSSGLKQTDIGVFFGLKPLKDKEVKNEVQEPQTSVSDRGARPQKGQRWKTEAAAKGEGPQSLAAAAVGDETVGETKRTGAKGWRRRRTTADGEVKYPRCPFYKKIPGTKLAVDAFRYGPIEGITAYFLTHFHSDHYDGLTKHSTLPIYCNKITGNLVKSKLKVPEQYVHILPMNTEVTVEGVKVILLDANQ